MTKPTRPSPNPLFPLGQTVATPGALDALAEAGVIPGILLHRHVHGDWGELDASDKRENEMAVKHADRRFLSAYVLPTGVKVWIITEWDRSVTTILTPEEY